MIIKKFKADNVHDYLNYEIDFNENLTFLIGINGTGKTSVLKLILGLISPSFNYLNSINYDFVLIECLDEQSNSYVISSKKTEDNEYTLELTINQDEPIPGKIIKLNPVQQRYLDFDKDDEHTNSIIEGFNEQKVVKRIKGLTTPLFLGLDRRVYEGRQIDRMRQSFFFRKKYKNFPTGDPLNISLIDIQEVIFDYYRIIASKQPEINQNFKNKILLQSFEFLDSQQINIIDDFKELRDKKQQALDAFDNLNIVGFKSQVDTFFEQLETVLKSINERRKLSDTGEIDKDSIEFFQRWFNNQPQLKRIDKLIEYNQAYQSEIEGLYEPIEKLKNIINKFFSESKKELTINAQGELKVIFKNGKEAEIFELSSGEKQIITMLGHLIFFEEKFKTQKGIFIIDEPEVSLHLAWQEIFVNSILEASPNTQFILATHSPAITGDANEELFEDLAKLN
jgi:predicted ATP-binding protein involved in virulence